MTGWTFTLANLNFPQRINPEEKMSTEGMYQLKKKNPQQKSSCAVNVTSPKPQWILVFIFRYNIWGVILWAMADGQLIDHRMTCRTYLFTLGTLLVTNIWLSILTCNHREIHFTKNGHKTCLHKSQWRIQDSPDWIANPKCRGVHLICWPIFLKNFIKTKKKIGPQGSVPGVS